MPEAFLLSRILLHFNSPSTDVHHELSAVTLTPDGSLWVASDEVQTIERLSPISPSSFGQHQAFAIGDYLDLYTREGEIDIEGLDYADGYLWFTGSHSTKRQKTKGKTSHKALAKLGTVTTERNRYLLGRIPVEGNTLSAACPSPQHPKQRLTAAALPKVDEANLLIETLRTDEHLGPFLSFPLPGKENGFDIEGLAAHDDHLFLGFRGPVLGRWASILEIAVAEDTPAVLSLQNIGPQDQPYVKHFIDLGGLGIRDLCLHGDDLLILAGPTMELAGALRLFRLRDVWEHAGHTLWRQKPGILEEVFDLPVSQGLDQAEGLTLFPWEGRDACVLIVYDAPDPGRIPTPKTVLADLLRLP